MDLDLNTANNITRSSNRDELVSTQSLLSRMSKLIELSNQISGALDFDKIIERVEKNVKWFLEYEYAVFALQRSPDREELSYSAMKKRPEHPDFVDLPSSYVEQLRSQKSPVVLKLEPEKVVLGKHFKWGLLLPLQNIEDENVGFIFFAKNEENKYNENDLRIAYLTSLQISSAIQNTTSYNELNRLTEEVRRERKKSDRLLHSILPQKISRELKEKGRVEPRSLDEVTVMFVDFRGFTRISEKLSASELLEELDYCFSVFDEIIDKYKVEKLKTIGDSYMCASGVTEQHPDHARQMIYTALEIKEFMNERRKEMQDRGDDYWGFRIGIHSGPVMAGVIGKTKYNFDIWGRTVNLASRMESAGQPEQITVSDATYQLIRDDFECSPQSSMKDKKGISHQVYTVVEEK